MEPQQLIDRFWAKVQKGEGCWEWQASLNPKGYGIFKFRRQSQASSRVAWILTNGEIPEGLHVLHDCHNAKCCNPAHLHLGTNLQNHQEKAEAGRGRKRELPPDTVAVIKADLDAGHFPATVAKKFNSNRTTVNLIKHGAYYGTTTQNR